MLIHHHFNQIYHVKYENNEYVTIPKNCITTIVNKITKCAPLITALIAIGTLFSLFSQIEARYILNERVETTTIGFIPDDVKIVYIGPPTRSMSCRFFDVCLWGKGRREW